MREGFPEGNGFFASIARVQLEWRFAASVPVSSPDLQTTSPIPDRRALEAYASWLFMERRFLCNELYPQMGANAERFDLAGNAGWDWHFRFEGEKHEPPQPSTRAAAVLDLVGVNWRAYPEKAIDPWLADNGNRPTLPAKWPQVDGDITQALETMLKCERAVSDLRKVHGDDADEREDYLEFEARREEAIEELSTIESRSMAGVMAKVAALQNPELIDDYARHQAVAVSLAEDLAQLAPIFAIKLPE
jgi:hypothetical protein